MSGLGVAHWVEEHAADPFSAASRALETLKQQTEFVDVAEVCVSTRIINPYDSEPYEAIAIASEPE